MSEFIIDITNTSSEKGSIVPDIGFNYTDNLNQINESNIKISSIGAVRRGLMELGSIIEIQRDGTLEFSGIIDDINNLTGGGVVFHASGKEIELMRETGTYSGSPWTSTASATIFSAIIGESTNFSAGTVDAGISIDYRLAGTQKLWNGLANLARKTAQDIQIDYTNTEVDILDHRGSSTVVATFNEGLQIQDLRVNYTYPAGNSVKVWGKGDGDDQITATATDATSISTYGTVKRDIVDRSIISSTEAQALADAEIAVSKNPAKIYDFDIINFAESITTGDHLYLNSSDQDLSNEEVRIVGLERGQEGNREFLRAQVTNPAYSRLVKKRNAILNGLMKNQVDSDSYMQGTSNVLTFSDLINADNTAPLRVHMQLPSSFIFDEAGNRRITSFTLDYDVDPYRKGVGDATVDNSLTGAGITNVQSTTGAGITNVGQTPTSTAGVSVWSSYTAEYAAIGNTKAICHVEENVDGDSSYYTTRIVGMYLNVTGGTVAVDRNMEDAGGNTYDTTDYSLGNNAAIYYSQGTSDTGNKTGYAYFWDDNFNCSLACGTQENLYEHDHGSHTHSNTFNDANHTNNNTFDDVNHDHTASIGDDVSDSGSTNATELSEIKVYHWNGSSWDLEHTITNTGTTLDTDVDLSNGDTLPDAAGFWKIEIKTDNASADLVQAIAKIKHQIDN